MAILYVAAEPLELRPFANRLTGVRTLKWPVDYAVEGIWESRRIMLVANGAGPKLAYKAVEIAIRAVTAAELSASRLEAVVNVGVAGGLDPNLKCGEIVIASAVVDGASQERFHCVPVSCEPPGKAVLVLTQDRVAGTAAEKSTLSRVAGAVDMEASGVAARAARAGLPFSCIKVISDTVGESFPVDFNAMRTSEGRISRVKIGLYAATRPGVLPRLIRLNASVKKCAEALGDFLVRCRLNLSETAIEPNNTVESG